MQGVLRLKLSRIAQTGAALILFSCISVLASEPICKVINFTDVEPKNFTSTEVWCGIGIDHDERVYLGITDQILKDVAVMQYASRTGEKKLLGTLRGISAADSNLGPNQYWDKEETFSKIHTPILEFENKMYFASHDYFKSPDSEDELRSHRGGHFYCFDLKSGVFTDLSKTDSAGISVPHQSIISMNIMPEERKLIGWTYPYGDVLAYDLAAGKTTHYRGPSAFRSLSGAVSRVVMTASNGLVYFSYGVLQTYLWELDLKTGDMDTVAYSGLLNTGLFNGLCKTRSGDTLYLKDKNGDLFRFAPESRAFDRLGTIMPKDEIRQGKILKQNSGLILSKDESKLYTMPYGKQGSASYHLFEYDLFTGAKRTLGYFANPLWGLVITGSSVVDDSNRVYFAAYDPQGSFPTGIVQIDLRPSIGIRDGRKAIVPVAFAEGPRVTWNRSAGRGQISFPERLSDHQTIIQIVSASGRLVREMRISSARTVFWDGRDANGGRVGNGLYVIRVYVKEQLFGLRLIVAR